ncbi:hypothetical protein ACLOJK_012735 [Asimina triloba]
MDLNVLDSNLNHVAFNYIGNGWENGCLIAPNVNSFHRYGTREAEEKSGNKPDARLPMLVMNVLTAPSDVSKWNALDNEQTHFLLPNVPKIPPSLVAPYASFNFQRENPERHPTLSKNLNTGRSDYIIFISFMKQIYDKLKWK